MSYREKWAWYAGVLAERNKPWDSRTHRSLEQIAADLRAASNDAMVAGQAERFAQNEVSHLRVIVERLRSELVDSAYAEAK